LIGLVHVLWITKSVGCQTSDFCWSVVHSFQGVRKASLRRGLGAKAQLEVKASRCLEIRHKATVAAEKNLKRGAAAAGRRKSGDRGSKSGFGDLRFGPESPSSPLIRGGGSSSRSGGDGWDRGRGGGGGSRGRGGGGGSRGRGGGDGAGVGGCCLCIAAGEKKREAAGGGGGEDKVLIFIF
jgi:hypothetical protein